MSSNSKYQGVLFDLDGTLLDTANDLGESLNYVLNKYSLPLVEREDYRPIASDGSTGLLNLGFKDKVSEYDFEQLREEFLTYYENNIAEHTQVYAGIASLISFLDDNDIPWGIVTNKPIGLTKILLPYFPLFKNCKSLIGGDSLAQRKPHPAPLLYACDEIGISASDCIYVGDAPRDIEAGNAANMFTVIAKWGYISDINACQLWNANIMSDTPKEISDLLSNAF